MADNSVQGQQSQTVTTAAGLNKTVIIPAGGSKSDLSDAVKLAKEDNAPVYPNINRPVQKGEDQVATGSDASRVLVDGKGAHNSPYNAIGDDGKETGDPNVKAAGLEEPAYKSVPVGGSQEGEPRQATDAEVKAAKKDAEPANEVQPQGSKDTSTKSSK